MTLAAGGVALALTLGLASGPQGTPTSKPSPDQAQVVSTMERMYVALTNDDAALFRSVVTPEFYAFDGGQRFEADALLQLVRTLHASGKVYVWRVTAPEVQVFGDMALITYVNRGSVQDPSGTQELEWLESAVLRKQNGSWRIRFFHSTRVPAA